MADWMVPVERVDTGLVVPVLVDYCRLELCGLRTDAFLLALMFAVVFALP